jgi:hypothetical protein
VRLNLLQVPEKDQESTVDLWPIVKRLVVLKKEKEGSTPYSPAGHRKGSGKHC